MTEDAKPRRTADNNDLFLLDECRSYARTMVRKLEALDRPDKVTVALVGVMEAVEESLWADTELRMLRQEGSR